MLNSAYLLGEFDKKFCLGRRWSSGLSDCHSKRTADWNYRSSDHFGARWQLALKRCVALQVSGPWLQVPLPREQTSTFQTIQQLSV